MDSNFNIKVPFILHVDGSFDDYIKGLSSNGKRWYNKCLRLNRDVTYSQEQLSFKNIKRFTVMWTETNQIEGLQYHWSAKDYADLLHHSKKKSLICYTARVRDEIICVHFVEKHEDYVYCHAPLYNKQKYSGRNISKFMWFLLIRQMFEDRDVAVLDMCWPYDPEWRTIEDADCSWKDLVYNHVQAPRGTKGAEHYKFLFLPKHVKQNPTDERPLVVVTEGYKKKIVDLC